MKFSRLATFLGVLVVCIIAGAVVPSAKAQTLTTLYSFCAQSDCTDGVGPYAGLVQGSDGNFYGTTGAGGNGTYASLLVPSGGTVFRITPSGTLTTLYSFCSQIGCTDGNEPVGGLVQGSDGNFYGTTAAGGANNGRGGTVFRITPSGTLTTLYSFCSQTVPGSGLCTDGEVPQAALVQGSDSNFYGTTWTGGANGSGTVFKITPTGTLTTLYTFCSQSACADGGYPTAGLVQGSDGNFYGTTQSGGSGIWYNGNTEWGTIFKITPSGALTTLYNFCSLAGCTDGYLSYGGLVQGSDGSFYGTTLKSGRGSWGTETPAWGTVFKITPSGALTTLYGFCSQSGCTDGSFPRAGLVFGSDGNFYGTTNSGGANQKGTVFQITPSGTLTTLYSFCSQSNCPDGTDLMAGLVQGSDGNLYGTAYEGGAYSYETDGETYSAGTVFKLGLSPSGTFSPTSLTFPSQQVNMPSAAQAVTVSNGGSGSLSVSNIAITGDDSADFSQTNDCASGLAAGQSCTINVTFDPTTSGPRSATLTITDNNGNVAGSTQTVTLTGTGSSAATTVSFSPPTDDFGNQAVGTTNWDQPIELYNTGNATLNISSLAITGPNAGDFAQSNDCGSSVAAGGQCTINVSFKPSASGTRTAAITFADNASGSPQTVTLTGTGTSTSGTTVGFSPATDNFGNQAVGTTNWDQPIELYNSGNATLNISSLAIMGPNAGDFAQFNDCGSSVAVGGQCTINVSFTPSAMGTRMAAITLIDNASGSPQTVTLTGTGTQ